MKRTQITPRQNWSNEVEKLGFDFYQVDGIPYWHESAYYEFTSGEIDKFEAAANTVHGLCLQAVDRIITERLFPFLGIEPELAKLITESWTNREPVVYGRFDFIYDGSGSPKLLEYNADTPSSLFEASIVQWNWREQVFPKADQFNSIHEHLVDRWRKLLLGRWLDDGRGGNAADRLCVTTAAPHPEDECTVQYIGQTAIEAGYKVKYLPIQNIGWNGTNFLDMDEQPIRQIFKLYPWEWLVKDDFGKNIKPSGSLWLEPIWKMLLSNKGILPILWDTFPEHENLLPAYRDPSKFGNSRYVEKPMLGREGANITIREGSKIISSSPGDYGNGVFIYQGFGDGAEFDGARPNLGVWMVNDEACGMGVREDNKLIVGNASRFVPHIFN
jgi:glutathionylspermidine synthase